jgi:hypothetical protein
MDDEQNNGLIPNVINWFAHPFNTKGSALNWVLFVGLLAIAAFFWNYVLIRLTGE